ncbi:phosphocholine cytidylyltransferase family protein [Paenibacillus nanensis]|uniref:Phosphocholine cytidylyltransferase family protein n=1 Tax=Paenibacillus nanensis TaxID=393251 RepID=A0A3A1URS4_9BACL|nr:NTP transferase domain-containing protein [Paenibacillus nanensis]RIX47317.1 phosphocholine cytidylyltransferase family protein [Paenibacillus nanensis]
MQAIILNSGTGSRMGCRTQNLPKCLLPLGEGHTVLSKQVDSLADNGIRDMVLTTGQFHDTIKSYLLHRYGDRYQFQFIHNDRFKTTNYIYSLHLIRDYINSDCILLHGDLVYESGVMRGLLRSPNRNTVLVSPGEELPEKDFKAHIAQGRILQIAINIFHDCKFLLPLYRLEYSFMKQWLEQINEYIAQDKIAVYAENALNDLLKTELTLLPHYYEGFCMEIDTEEDYSICLSRNAL